MTAIDNAVHRHAPMCSTSALFARPGACDCDLPDAVEELASLRAEVERLRAALVNAEKWLSHFPEPCDDAVVLAERLETNARRAVQIIKKAQEGGENEQG